MEADNNGNGCNGNGNDKTPNKSGKARRLANLAPKWQPGQSGNPNGMPAGTPTIRSFTNVVREMLAQKLPDGRTRLQRLAEALEAQALEGGGKAADLILERIDPAMKNVNVTTNERSKIMGALDDLLKKRADVLEVHPVDDST